MPSKGEFVNTIITREWFKTNLITWNNENTLVTAMTDLVGLAYLSVRM